MMRPITFFSALALGALSGSAYAQQGGGSGGLGDTGLGDARARNLPTSQGINNGYENGVYWGAPGGPQYGYNSPPMSFQRGYGYGYPPGYAYVPGPYQGRSVYVDPQRRWHHHRRHW
jgi:hypothetical protein